MLKVNIKKPRTMASTPYSSVSIVNFEQVNAGWVSINLGHFNLQKILTPILHVIKISSTNPRES